MLCVSLLSVTLLFIYLMFDVLECAISLIHLPLYLSADQFGDEDDYSVSPLIAVGVAVTVVGAGVGSPVLQAQLTPTRTTTPLASSPTILRRRLTRQAAEAADNSDSADNRSSKSVKFLDKPG